MNFITTNCLGATTYKIMKQQFGNPFIWCGINFNNFMKLISCYDEIDFNDIYVYVDYAETDQELHGKVVWIDINNKVKVEFIHYHVNFDSKYFVVSKGPTHRSICWNSNMIEYAKQKYLSRLSNMKKQSPIFALYYAKWFKNEYKNIYDTLDRYFNLDTKYQKILIIENDAELFEYVKQKYENMSNMKIFQSTWIYDAALQMSNILSR